MSLCEGKNEWLQDLLGLLRVNDKREGLVERTVTDLRSLYRSARRMGRSDEVMVLMDYLVEDIVSCTELERVLVLKLDEQGRNLETQVFYGFKEVGKRPFSVDFQQVNGLLRKVYTEQEPLNVVGFSDLPEADQTVPRTCGILRDDYRGSGNRQNRRQRVNLCVPDFASEDVELKKYSRFRHFSVMDLDAHDKTVKFLMGDVSSFLILPICDNNDFYGYVLADKAFTNQPVSYEEIRLSSAIASHSALAIGRALKQKSMLRKIARQLAEIEYLKSFYESIIQNLRSGLITVDQFMKITDVNKAAEIILGYKREEMLSKPLDDFLSPMDGKKCLFLDAADEMDNTMGHLSEVPMKKKSGDLFPSEVCFSVITDSSDTVTGLSCIFRDITAKKVLEQDLARVDKLASLGEMAAGMAHEIKNPLAGISGAMQILARNFDQGDTNQLIFNEVQSQVKRLDNFINSLLQFAKPGQSQFSEVDLIAIVKKALFLSAPRIDDKEIKVIESYESDAPIVQGDDGQLQQVFLNIVLNAIDSMGKDGVLTIRSYLDKESGTIRSRNECMSPSCRSMNGYFKVAVQDTGSGIDPDSMEMIFNPFHTTKGNGTGLGLSISHRILEQHGGTIIVESEPEVGSNFIVCLPVCRP
ncbi:MAG: PAS domain S-box protein [Desulfobulbaceae bacterium]|nr:PAS domain S-box protein [Desulfobulbaceae bacterium]